MHTIKVLTAALLLAGGAALAQTPAPQRIVPTDAPVNPPTATIELGAEYPQLQLKGYTLTQTLNTIAPGTGRAMHSHVGNPEIVRIISGTLTEAHDGGPPMPYGPGSTIVNAQGKQHMWANLGSVPVVFIATSIRVPAPPAPAAK